MRSKNAQRASSTKPKRAALRRQAHVGIVLAQGQPVFGAAREHAVRLGRTARDQIVDQHADIGLAALRAPGILPARLQRGIRAREQTLGRGLLITGRAVDLSGEEQAREEFALQAALQVARIEEVIFDRVSGSRDVRALEAGDRAHELALHVEGEARGDAVRIDFVSVESLGFDEDLVRELVGVAHDLVLDRRTIARPDPFDAPGEHR